MGPSRPVVVLHSDRDPPSVARPMKIAHVRERHAAAGTPWRLAAALDEAWLDLEIARRRAVVADGNLAHDRVLHRQPVTTLDDHLGRGLRVEALAELVDGFEP